MTLHLLSWTDFVWRKPCMSVRHQYNLSFADSWSECVLDIVTIEHEVPDGSPVHIAYMKNLAMRNIK
jgi:hypothetical protein